MLKYFRSFSGIRSLLRKHFITGVFVLIPFAVVAWIASKVFLFFWSFQEFVPDSLHPDQHFDPVSAQLLNLLIMLALSFLFIISIAMLGWVSKQVIGAQMINLMSRWIERIPVVRSIYGSLNQLMKTMGNGDKQQFSRVVYLEYPRKGTYALAFVTGHAKSVDGIRTFLNVYVPTTPNPTSGFHLIVDEAEVKDSHMSVEDAFKTILSLGIAQS